MAGAATTTSTSTTTIISTATRILVVATATTLVAETAHRNNRAAAAEAAEIPAGNTIRNIAAAPRMVIEVPRTSLEVRLEETRFRIVRLAHGNRLADRAEIWPAVAEAELA